MSGSNAFASPATLTRSGTGGIVPGWKRDRKLKMEMSVITRVVNKDVHDLVMVLSLLLMKENAASNGSV